MLSPAICDTRPNTASVSIFYIARRAGREDKGAQFILNLVRMYVANEGFPVPLPDYATGGRKIAGVALRSRWQRAAVDAWFDGHLPPIAVTIPDQDDRLAAAHASALDAAAERIAA